MLIHHYQAAFAVMWVVSTLEDPVGGLQLTQSHWTQQLNGRPSRRNSMHNETSALKRCVVLPIDCMDTFTTDSAQDLSVTTQFCNSAVSYASLLPVV